MAYIKRIGIELEGGWDSRPASPIHSDGSVSVEARYAQGEISSKPMYRADLPAFLEANYPAHVNTTCGLHIHTSLCNIGRYSQLTNVDFFLYWKEQMRAFGKRYPIKSDAFWSRLEGNNSYCRDRFRPREQMEACCKVEERYALLNYCYSLHGTIECRALPMFKDSAVALAAINAHLDTIESYLALHTHRFGMRTFGRVIESGELDLNPPELFERTETITAIALPPVDGDIEEIGDTVNAVTEREEMILCALSQ